MKCDKNPDFDVSYRKHGDALYFKVTGDVDSRAVRIAYWHDIANIVKSEGLRKILVVDREKKVPPTPEDLMQLAVAMQMYREIVDWVAIVEPTPEFLSSAEHAEIEGRVVGFNVRVFSRIEDAERWLLYGMSDQA